MPSINRQARVDFGAGARWRGVLEPLLSENQNLQPIAIVRVEKAAGVAEHFDCFSLDF